MFDRLKSLDRRTGPCAGTGRVHPDLRVLDEHTLRDIGLQRSAGTTGVSGRDRLAAWPFLV